MDIDIIDSVLCFIVILKQKSMSYFEYIKKKIQ